MSFNYTDTLEKVYGIKDVLHLHGGILNIGQIVHQAKIGNTISMLRNLRLIILMSRRMTGLVMSTICLHRPIQDRIGVK